jgi:hypothetical protein
MLFRAFAAVRRFNISFGTFPACWKLEWFLWECSEDWVANRSGPIAGNYQRSNRTDGRSYRADYHSRFSSAKPPIPKNTPACARFITRARHIPSEGKPMSTAATQLMRLPQVRVALGVTQNRTVLNACRRFNIPVVAVSCRMKAICASDLERLICRASGVTHAE